MLVSQILHGKGAVVHTIGPNASVSEAIGRLRELGIGALVVSENGRRVVGILSERDIIHGLAESGPELLGQPVSEIMTSEVLTSGLNDTSQSVMAHMTDSRIRHVPIVEDGELRGMVSIGDIVKSRLDEITHEADALREYIHHS